MLKLQMEVVEYFDLDCCSVEEVESLKDQTAVCWCCMECYS